MHTPVLLQEVMDGLQIHEGGRYIDATVGEGGHMLAMLERGAYVLGIDQDKEQIEKLKKQSLPPQCTLVQGNFADLKALAKKAEFQKVDGVLFDLGISWAQLADSGRGLSYKAENESLDMRLREDCQLSASEILNSYSAEQLYEVFAKNAEELHSRKIAEVITELRKKKKVSTVRDLRRAIDKAVGSSSEGSYARIFQALRIEVNDEFANLKSGLEQAILLLGPKGRVAVITFHSVEDRMVKRFIREGGYRQVTKKAIAGDRSLSFERSAKLRVFEL